MLVRLKYKTIVRCKMIKIDDKVKALKWRDNGETGEVLYIGKVLGHADSDEEKVQIEVIKSKRGWKKGDIEVASIYEIVKVK